MTNSEVRLCRFVQWQPSAVNICSADPSGSLVAVVREKAGMELLASTGMQSIGHFVGAASKNIQSVAWSQNEDQVRLFTTGLDGLVVEWDQDRFLTARVSDTHAGGAGWSCAVSPDQKSLIVGCENGCIRLYDLISLKGKSILKLSRSHELQKGCRVLSVSWSLCGNFVACGTGSSRIYVVQVTSESAKTVHVLNIDPMVARDSKNNRQKSDTLVWALAFTSVAGETLLWSSDSSGHVCSWSLETGTLVQSLEVSTVDLFSLVVANNVLFTAGADQRLHEIKCSEMKRSWFLASSHSVHSHDIRSLTLLNESNLVSGSVDTRLAVHRLDKNTQVQYDQGHPRTVKTLNNGIWANEGESLRAWIAVPGKCEAPPRQVLHLHYASDRILDFDITQTHIVCKMAGGLVKAYKYSFGYGMNEEVEDVTLDEIKIKADNILACVLDGDRIVAVQAKSSENASLISISLDGESHESKVICEIPFKSCAEIILHGNSILVLSSDRKQVHICTTEKKKLSTKTVDLITPVRTIMSIPDVTGSESNVLLVGEKTVGLLSVSEARLLEWPKTFKAQLNPILEKLPEVLIGASCTDNKVYLYGSKTIVSMPAKPQVTSNGSTETTPKVRRSTRRTTKNVSEPEEIPSSSTDGSIKTTRAFSGLLYAGCMSDSSFLIVERHWDEISSGFPPVVKRKQFGGFN